MAELSSDEMERLQREGTEENWAKLWKTFFTAIAIEERKNPNCQRKSPAFTVQGSYDGVSVINLLQILLQFVKIGLQFSSFVGYTGDVTLR